MTDDRQLFHALSILLNFDFQDILPINQLLRSHKPQKSLSMENFRLTNTMLIWKKAFYLKLQVGIRLARNQTNLTNNPAKENRKKKKKTFKIIFLLSISRLLNITYIHHPNSYTNQNISWYDEQELKYKNDNRNLNTNAIYNSLIAMPEKTMSR